MHVVILGAGYAGLLCAFRLRRRAGDGASITVVSRDDAFVERVRLHEWLNGTAPPRHALAPWLSAQGITFVHGTASSVDLAARTVRVGDTSLSYDRLVLALGSHSATDIPGADAHAHTFERADALRAKLPTLRGDVVVVGAGLTGLEAATEIAERHPDTRVRLVHRGAFAPYLSAPARDHVLRVFARLGVTVTPDAAVRAITERAVATDRGELPSDATLLCAGFALPTLARDAGLTVDAQGAVVVDEALRAVGHREVYAIGDCAATGLQRSCKTAMPTGAYAADALAAELDGASHGPFTFRDTGVCVSLGRRDAVVQAYRDGVAPEGLVFTGRTAVFIKERICRYTLWSLRAQAAGTWDYRWLRAGTSRTLAAAH